MKSLGGAAAYGYSSNIGKRFYTTFAPAMKFSFCVTISVDMMSCNENKRLLEIRVEENRHEKRISGSDQS